jgi:hypothetical protein
MYVKFQLRDQKIVKARSPKESKKSQENKIIRSYMLRCNLRVLTTAQIQTTKSNNLIGLGNKSWGLHTTLFS